MSENRLIKAWNILVGKPEKRLPSSKNAIGKRMYAGAKQSRLTSGWGSSQTSADSEIMTSLRTLRARSREMVRDAPYAKRAKTVVVNNIIGSGMGMQAQVKTQRGETLITRINDEIEAAWEEWSRGTNCHTGGELHFCDIERLAMGQVFEAGEIFIRKHYRPFGDSTIPFCLEIIEPERVVDEWQPSPVAQNARVRMGIESDEFGRPIAYWIRKIHPGELRLTAGETDMVERVPADQIYHLRIIDRTPQARGVPWLHAVLRKLNDMDGYSEAEIIAARGAACYMATIETQTDEALGEEQPDGSTEMALEAGTVERLNPGEHFNFVNPGRPNAAMDPFMRMMLREMASGIGASYETLSRDYSQSNYSSSRMGILDDRDLWRICQTWFIRSFRSKVHREWLQQAIFSKTLTTIAVEDFALDSAKYAAVRFKPRGWSWVDPTSEVEAYKEAIKAGLTTNTDVIAQTANGRDIEDILDERAQELALMKEKGLIFDTDPSLVKPATSPGTNPTPTPNAEGINYAPSN